MCVRVCLCVCIAGCIGKQRETKNDLFKKGFVLVVLAVRVPLLCRYDICCLELPSAAEGEREREREGGGGGVGREMERASRGQEQGVCGGRGGSARRGVEGGAG